MKVTDDNIQTLLRESEEAYTNAYRDFVNDFNKVAYTDYVYKAVEDYEKAVKEYVGKLKYIINTVLNSDTDDNDTENTESTESTESTENNSNKNEDVDYEKYSKVENVETVELNARIKESFSVIGEASGELIKRGYKKAAEVIKSGMKTGADKVADFVDTVYSNIENDADEDDNFGEDLTKEEIVENITDLEDKLDMLYERLGEFEEEEINEEDDATDETVSDEDNDIEEDEVVETVEINEEDDAYDSENTDDSAEATDK